MRLLFALFVALATPAHSETLDNPYGSCDQQTLDEAVALDRLPGDKSFLRDHLRSFGCRLTWPREGLRVFAPQPGELQHEQKARH
jgi:hypothetical protein